MIKASGLFEGAGLYSLSAFKLAFPVQILVMSLGILMFYRDRRLTLAVGEDKSS
jgi:hypothetical protein